MTNRFDPNDVILVGSDDGETPNGKYVSSTNPLYVQPIDFFVAAGLGLIPGWSSLFVQGALFPEIGVSGVKQTLWGESSRYIWPNTVETLEVVSDSSDDTSTGIGARSITFNYLDVNLDPKSVTVNLNGTTPVQVATDYYRPSALGTSVVSAGSNATNVGNIKIRRITDQATRSVINAEKGRSFDAIFTVPKGESWSPNNVFANIAKNYDINLEYLLRLPTTGVWFVLNEFNAYQSSNAFKNFVYLFLPEGTDFEGTVVPNQSGVLFTWVLEVLSKEVS